MIKKKLLIALLVSFIFGFSGSLVFAEPSITPTNSVSGTPTPTTDSTQQVKDLQSKINDLQGKISDLHGQEKTLSSQISVMDNQINLTQLDRKSTRLNSSHQIISYAVFCLKKKKTARAIDWHLRAQ